MSQRKVDQPALTRYSIAGLSMAGAAGLTAAIQPFFDGKAPLFFFIVASLVSAATGEGVRELLSALSAQVRGAAAP